MSSYIAIQPQLERWAAKHALILNSSPWNGGESRCVWLSSKAGECFQIWIEPPVEGFVRLHAAGVESRRDDDPPQDWMAPVSEIAAALDEAYDLVVEWMRPSKHFHPSQKASLKSNREP